MNDFDTKTYTLHEAIDFVSEDGTKVRHLDEHWKDMFDVAEACVKSVRCGYKYLNPLLKEDPRIVRATLDNDPYEIRNVPDNCRTKEVFMRILSRGCGVSFLTAQMPAEVLDDTEVMTRYARYDPFSTQYASDRLNDDDDFALHAVNKDGGVIRYFSDRIRDDKGIVMMAVMNRGMAYNRISDRLKDDRDVILASIDNNYEVFKDLSPVWQNDKEVCLLAVKKDGYNIRHCGHTIINDRSVVTIASKGNMRILRGCDFPLANDPWLNPKMSRNNRGATNLKRLMMKYLKRSYYSDVYSEFLSPDNHRMKEYMEHFGDDDADKYLPSPPPHLQQIFDKCESMDCS